MNKQKQSKGTVAATNDASISAGWHKHRQALADWAMKYVVNRTDVCGAYTSLEARGQPKGDGTLLPNLYTSKNELTLERLIWHFSKGARPQDVIGVHTIGINDDCKVASLDIDAHASEVDADAAERNLRFAMQLFHLLYRLGLKPLLWDSNGKGGYHIDVIFDKPIPAAIAFRLGRWLIKDWKEAGFTHPPESFPKQPTRFGSSKELGNWLRIVGRHHTRDIWARVYDHESGEWVEGESAALAVLAHQPVTPSAIPAELMVEPIPELQQRNHAENYNEEDIEKSIDAALAVLSPDVPHDDGWLDVGLALHSHDSSEAGRAKWDSWSRTSKRYQDGITSAKWSTFKSDGGITIRTLFHMADNTGRRWRPDKPKRTNGTSNDHSVYSEDIVYAPEEWGDPIPLAEEPVAPCPVDAIPEGPREFLIQLAEFTQTPVDLAVGQWLAACAIAVQKKFVVEPSRGWQEQLSLYVLSVMEPANRKSAVVSAISGPIRQFEAQQRQAMSASIRQSRSQHEVRLKQRNRLVDEAAKAPFGSERNAIIHDLELLDDEIAKNIVPSEPTMLADDITPEHMATLMSRNGGRLGVLTAEGDLFDIIGGRYSKAPNLGIILKAHSGDEVRVDRGNRPSELIRRPALSMGFCAQPDVLRGLLEQDRFRGRGMMGRLLYQIPESLLGRRKTKPAEVDPLVEVAYQNSMEALLKLPAEEDDDGYKPRSLRLTQGADGAFCEFREHIEKAFLDFNSLSQIKDWGGKLPGAVARIAGILHLVAYTEYTEIPQQIEAGTLANAIRLGEYFVSHAQSAFRIMGRNEDRSLAELIVATLRRHNFVRFTKRDVHQIVRRHVDSPDALDRPLELLVEHGHLRELESAKQTKGRKRSPQFEVNPKLQEASPK